MTWMRDKKTPEKPRDERHVLCRVGKLDICKLIIEHLVDAPPGHPVEADISYGSDGLLKEIIIRDDAKW